MGAAPLSVGDRAPAWTLKASDGTTVRLSDLRGQRVVLYFYPKDDTPGCTKEACDFQARRTQLAGARTVVLGVSRDDLTSHQRFATKYRLTFPLLSDPDAKVCKAYGVYTRKSLYGRTFWGIERTTFLIDAAGRIAAIYPKVRVDGHVDAILDTLRSTVSPDGRTTAPTSAGAH